MPTIKPFRQYSENDVINLYAISGNTMPVNKGTFVKVVGSGFVSTAQPVAFNGAIGAAYGNTVSQRYTVNQKVAVAGTGDTTILGMTLYDVREVDEQGIPLLFDPTKCAEMQAVPSGYPVPIVTKGIFLYSGITNPVTGGARAYMGANGELSTVGPGQQVGTFLGVKDASGFALLKLDL